MAKRGFDELDLQDEDSVRAWLSRCLELPVSLLKDDSLEEMRWDLAHYFFKVGATWNAAHVIAGNLTPWQHGMRKQSDALHAKIEGFCNAEPSATKERLKELMADIYDTMSLEKRHARA